MACGIQRLTADALGLCAGGSSQLFGRDSRLRLSVTDRSRRTLSRLGDGMASSLFGPQDLIQLVHSLPPRLFAVRTTRAVSAPA